MLAGFLDMEQDVKQRIADLDKDLWQTESDQITLSGYLGRIEQIARRPGIRRLHCQPAPVEHRASQTVYPLHITLAGTLPEVVRFARELVNGSTVVGIRSFSVRAAGGYQQVTCTLSIWMLTCRPDPGSPQHPEP